MPYQIKIHVSKHLPPRSAFHKTSDFYKTVLRAWKMGRPAQYKKANQVSRTLSWLGLKVQFYEGHELWTASTEEMKLWVMMNQPADAQVVQDTP